MAAEAPAAAVPAEKQMTAEEKEAADASRQSFEHAYDGSVLDKVAADNVDKVRE